MKQQITRTSITKIQTRETISQISVDDNVLSVETKSTNSSWKREYSSSRTIIETDRVFRNKITVSKNKSDHLHTMPAQAGQLGGRQAEVRQVTERSPKEDRFSSSRLPDLIIILLVIAGGKKLFEMLLPVIFTKIWGVILEPDDIRLITEYILIWTLQNWRSILASGTLIPLLTIMLAITLLKGS